jgi:transcriptional antiterminator RfaH
MVSSFIPAPAGLVQSQVEFPGVAAQATPELAIQEWYVLQAKPRQEARVVRHLARSAVPTFLPFVEVGRRRAMGSAKYLEPLFPGYVFVALPPIVHAPADWSSVNWTPGVLRVLSIGATPVPVPQSFIQAIEERIADCGFVRLPSIYTNGMKVRVRGGSFDGIEAVFDQPLSRRGRVRVLLQLLGQPAPVELDEECLEPA